MNLPASVIEHILRNCRVRGFTIVAEMEPMVLAMGAEPESVTFFMKAAGGEFHLDVTTEPFSPPDLSSPPAVTGSRPVIRMTAFPEGTGLGGHVLLTVAEAAKAAHIRAKQGYERYVAHCGGRSVHGELLPEWQDQSEDVRGHWIAAFTEDIA